MTRPPAEPQASKPSKLAGLTFLFVILATMLKSVAWRLKGASPQRESERFWDLMARDFDRNSRNEKVERNRKRIVEIIGTYLDAGDAVLDYGCGTGTTSLEIADRVKRILGVDTSGKMIEAASGKASALGIENVEFTKGTIFDDAYEKESLDVVLALNVLHLLPDAPRAVDRIHELLKPDGLFISVTECMGEKWSLLNSLVSALSAIGVLPRFTFFKVSELEETALGGRFRMIRAESFYDFGSQPSRLIVGRKSPPRRLG